MNQHLRPSLAMLALISAVATLPMQWLRTEQPLWAQGTAEPTPTFRLQESVAPGTELSIDGSPAMAGINQSLAEGFETRYPDTAVNHLAEGDDQALQALRRGNVDLAALGRTLAEAEQDPSLTSIPVTREKIAVIVGRDNSFEGDLTFESFAAIFRGEITNWSEIGGPNLPIRFVDRPAESDTRLALGDYEIFSRQPFETGETAVQLSEDSTAAVVRELGNDGISYAIASEVLDQDAVRPLSMHGTLPDDDRYPYSQPRNYIYEGEPSPAIEAFLGFATSEEGQEAIAAAKQIASANVTVGASRLPGGVALAPDGRFMVRGTEDGQLQWLDDAGNPTDTVVADAHQGAVSTVVVSTDGQTVISSGADGTLRRWDRNGAPIGEPLVGQGAPILALALSPDGSTVASGNADGIVERWLIADGAALGNPITAHNGPVQALHYPAGGQALITGSSDGNLGFWNGDGSSAGQIEAAHEGGITAITSSPDGQVLTTTGGDGTLRNWDRSTLQPRGEAIPAHDGAVSAVAYAPDGNTLATAGTDSTLQLWLPDGTAQLPEPVQLDQPAASLGYTPAGQLVVGSSDRSVELRDGQGERVSASPPEDPSADPTEGGDGNPLWQRLRNLPPSAWWMLAAVPAVLLLAGLLAALFGRKDRDDDPEDDELLEAGLVPSPGSGAGSGIDFSGLGGRPAIAVGPLPETDDGEAGRLPPEADLVTGAGLYPVGVAPNKLEQARIDLAEGRRLMREGRHDTALIYFNQAVEATEVERSKAEAMGVAAQGLNAIAAQAQAQRGAALALLGEPNEAMDSFNTALELDSSVIEAWVGKGRLLSTLGRYDEAIFCFDTALELDPSLAAAWLGKGQALMPMGRQSEAQDCLARATALGSDDPALANLGQGAGGNPEADLSEDGATDSYDPDVPFDLQQIASGLPSADVEISGSSPSGYDIPPDLAAEVALLPDHAEDAVLSGVAQETTGAGSISAGPLPADSDGPAQELPPDPLPSEAITPGPIPPSPLEDELLSQIHLSVAADRDLAESGMLATGQRATTEAMPPLRPAPVPVPEPVLVEPGDYVPPPPEPTDTDTDTDVESGLEGLPPEVVAALSSIPPSSPDSFGVAPANADAVVTAAPKTASWIQLSIDRQSDRFYAVWQLDEGDRAQAKQQGGTTMTLRLYDVTGHATHTPLPKPVAEQLCRDDFAQDWYLPIRQWDRIYVVEVGYLSPDGDWQAIAQSKEIAAISAQP
ncbi:substrate-binding domain-containing protein [Nodosilinea sp. E11]|uniref:substrate-binding domain-containing protein n=1 Tax=Nodosilinea sp. E11 TaxID=3037479 RepID=UPI002934A3AF|nr:substrate-binding domain-containing protein [Nodosilinea sp. E11]WOD41237.1 substrate-binding domain-containing protein [Nodosilinea sp. E11]